MNLIDYYDTWIHNNNLVFIINKNNPLNLQKETFILLNSLKKQIPLDIIYLKRFYFELKLIIDKNLISNIIRVIDVITILKNNNIPHIIRGSSGSSLICYLLDITNIDPIKYNINFARFLNKFRTKLPDFDIDIPHVYHNYAFKLIHDKWNNKVARISNHVCYSKKGALQKAKRINKISSDKYNMSQLNELSKDFIGKFKYYSLHCGGIIFDDNGFNNDIIIKSNDCQIQQVKYNKDDIEKYGFLKIDILSNRGLTQLFDISSTDINDYPDHDDKIIELFANGFNIGLTFCESPGMKKILKLYKPKNIFQLAECLSLIRPMANDSKNIIEDDIDIDILMNTTNRIIFDDDAITYIKKLINCSDDMADKIRRAFSKGDWNIINLFMKKVNNNNAIKNRLLNLKKYSFCKSHALSYAKLVWCLAYNKIYKPKEFWISTLNNCNTMYRKWVHFRQAFIEGGIQLSHCNYPYKLVDNRLISKRSNNFYSENISKIEQLKKYGYWIDNDFMDDCYVKIKNKKTFYVEFKGLVACSRWIKKWINNIGKKYYTYITIGYSNGHFIDLKIDDKWIKSSIFISGYGIYNKYNNNITVDNYTLIY